MIESRSYTLVLDVRSLFVMINAVDRSMDKMTIKGSLNYRGGKGSKRDQFEFKFNSVYKLL